MKKFLLSLLLLFAAMPVSAMTLSQFYHGNLPSIKKRQTQALACGVSNYQGTFSQNVKLLKCLAEGKLGFSVATGYSSTLSASITSNQNFIPVSSLKLKDASTLNINILGGVVFLDLEPGSSKEEIEMCTGITASPPQFTSCTRGLAFSGTSTAAVSANQKSHNAGSTIVISNVHYVYEQFVDINAKNQNIAGVKTFASGTIYITSSSYGFRVLNGMLQWSVDGFANSYNFTSSTISTLTASTTAGININNGQIATVVSSTQGMAFGPDGAIYQKTSSTLAVGSDINGIYIITSTLSSLIATGTPTAGMIPITNASGTLDNWITVTNSFKYDINTIPTISSFTSIPQMFTTSTVSPSTTISGTSYAIPLMGSSTVEAAFIDPNEIRIKFRLKTGNVDNNGNNSDFNIGFTPVVTNLSTASTSASARVVFIFSDTTVTHSLVSTLTANGSTKTTNIITGLDGSLWHTYEIIYSPVSAIFYVDGVLKFTHLLNLPTSGVVLFGIGDDVNSAVYKITNPVITQQL